MRLGAGLPRALDSQGHMGVADLSEAPHRAVIQPRWDQVLGFKVCQRGLLGITKRSFLLVL